MTNVLLHDQIDRYSKSLHLFLKTISKLERFNKESVYTDAVLELYDASGARFTRTYECAIKLFRAKDLLDSIETTTSYRELIHKWSLLDGSIFFLHGRT